jgi:hypothetical protein
MLADLLGGFVVSVSTSWRVGFRSTALAREKLLERLEPGK